MLQSIHIQNYALIDRLEINFEKGFSVITGETGAGKSIILGAIGLLLGQRADSKSIKQGAAKCIIEGRFDISGYGLRTFFEERDLEYEAECIIRRELAASGKSRAFINDTPASLAQMKELGELLIDIHSQHQNLLLNREDFQLSIVDILAGSEKEQQAYREAFLCWKSSLSELQHVSDLAARNKKDEDYLRFQLTQLEEAALNKSEQEMLEQEAEILNHSEEIKEGLYKVEHLLQSDDPCLLSSLKESLHLLKGLEKVWLPATELSERVESTYIELKDISREIASLGETIEFNPARLKEVNDRLNLIYTLQQKHHVNSVDELLLLAKEYREKLDSISSLDDRIATLHTQCNEQYLLAGKLAGQLTAKRRKAASVIEKEMVSRLALLGMPHVRFSVQLDAKKELALSGADSVLFLFSANKSGSLQNISSVASGGEIARVMLSLKAMIAGAVKLPTIIFDEIDTGVSGEIADKMAGIMQKMGNNHRQVISITHLPQIACRGSVHYKVFKKEDENGTQSNICRLNDAERVEEIAHMLSGAVLTDAAINNARELLKTTKGKKDGNK